MSRTRKPTTALKTEVLMPDGAGVGAMTWVLAILLFVTVLIAALGLSMAGAALSLSQDVGRRVTIQIVEANPDIRHAQTQALAEALQHRADVARVRVVPYAELHAILDPWLGTDMSDIDLPSPALIDVTLADGEGDADTIAAAARTVAPAAKAEPDARWLGPLVRLLSLLTALAAGVIVLMMVGVAAAVMLAARAALNTHRPTIDILRLLGSSDRQISSLFQRRIVRDALVAGALGLAGAVVVLIGMGFGAQMLQAEVVGANFMPLWAWAVLPLLPLLAVALARTTARQTIMRRLRSTT